MLTRPRHGLGVAVAARAAAHVSSPMVPGVSKTDAARDAVCRMFAFMDIWMLARLLERPLPREPSRVAEYVFMCFNVKRFQCVLMLSVFKRYINSLAHIFSPLFASPNFSPDLT